MAGQAPPERTEDGRYIVVAGRRWRASDPGIPDALRQELVDELMDARRAVGAAKRGADADADGNAEATARARVQAAKVALGERGHPWWEPATDGSPRERLEAAVLALARRRAPGKTICPSDAARAVGGESWRDDMDLAREVVRGLAQQGVVEVLQKGERLAADADWKGPIRVRAIDTGPG